MKKSVTLLYAVLAGICIGLGGIAYLSAQNPIIGAFLFSVGLFSICTLELNLFTGKILYIFENDKHYALNLIIIWVGNLIGAVSIGLLTKFTRIAKMTIGNVTFAEKAANLCSIKLSDNLLSIFILAVFCNIMIFIAVESYNKNPHEIGKYMGIILGVMIFVLSGFEHCIADMFYFTAGNAWSLHTIVYLIVITAGNAVGGLIFPICKIIKNKYE